MLAIVPIIILTGKQKKSKKKKEGKKMFNISDIIRANKSTSYNT